MKATLVLEIGNAWLKMALLRVAIGTHYVKALGTRGVENLSEEAIAGHIADFLKEFKVKKPQSIIVSFPRSSVTLRNLRIPSATPAEIEDMIKLHVGRQVPYAKEEIVSGHRVIGKDTMGYSKVMLAIVHRESIRKVFRILEKAGLYTDRLELSSDGVLSWLSLASKGTHLKPQEAFVMLDIDYNFTDFIVSTPENILFSRVINLGASQLADHARWPKFIGEMKQTVVISQGEELMQKPAKIYLSGVLFGLEGLSSTIGTEFNLPVEVLEPLTRMPLAKGVVKKPPDLLEKISVSPLLGLGLDAAKSKISFVLPEAQVRRMLRDRIREMIFLGSIIMYLILVICGIYMEKMHNRQAYLNLMKIRYEAMGQEAKALSVKVERIKKIKAKRSAGTSALNYLLEVVQLLPKEIVVKSLSIERAEKAVLKGMSEEMSDVFAFITTLEKSPYFKDVQTRYATRKTIKGREINEFELICPVETGLSMPKKKTKKRSARKAKVKES